MKPGLGNLMRQAQQLQESMQKAQAELGSLEVTGESGGGMVRVTMTGRHEVRAVRIDTAALGNDKDMIEDLVAAAVNDAVHKVEAKVQEKYAGMMSGVPLPPGMKMPWG
jgi:DNA-binding YbaB/EbfC family protein